MKFINIAAVVAIGLTGQALSQPALVERQSGGIIGILQNTIGILNTAVTTDIGAILGVVTKIGAGEQAIAAAVKNATADIGKQLGSAAGTVLNSTITAVKTLTAPEIAALVGVLNTVTALTSALGGIVNTLGAVLTGNIRTLLLSEIKAATSLLKPLVDPLIAFASNITGTGAGTGALTTAALRNAVTQSADRLYQLGNVSWCLEHSQESFRLIWFKYMLVGEGLLVNSCFQSFFSVMITLFYGDTTLAALASESIFLYLKNVILLWCRDLFPNK